MITGKTKSGFEFEISENIGDDWEMLKFMTKIRESNDILSLPVLVEHVLGAEQAKALEEHCRAEDGHVSTERLSEEFFDIFAANAETKK